MGLWPDAHVLLAKRMHVVANVGTLLQNISTWYLLDKVIDDENVPTAPKEAPS